LDKDCFAVISGGVPETTELLKQKFDHILYTGNGTVARIVMKAAAEYLTPVTLELGGKSPCIVDKNVKLSVAVPRIVFGKFLNCGQTCICPDYVYVHKEAEKPFLGEVKKCITRFYGANAKESKDYGKLINERQTRRVADLLKGQNIFVGGKSDISACYIEPTVVLNPDPKSPLMQEEIFGPVLPVFTYTDVNDVVSFINERPKPLALYVFTSNSKLADDIVSRVPCGGVTINDTLMHNLCPNLPFGGVGESGMGHYNGRFSFETFSHQKAVLKKPLLPDPAVRFPPCDPKAVKGLTRFAYYKLPLFSPVRHVLLPLLVIMALVLAWHRSSHFSLKQFF